MILAGALIGLLAAGLIAEDAASQADSLAAAGPAAGLRPQVSVDFDEEGDNEVLPEWAEDLSATMTLSSEYVFRGISQTDGEFAPSGSIEYTHESGLEVGVWSSSVEAGRASSETDLWIGYTLEDAMPELDLNGELIHYMFAGDEDLNYTEIVLSATFEEFVTGLVGFTSDLLGTGEDGLYLAGSVEQEMVEDINLIAGVGWYQSDAFDVPGADDNYLHYWIGGNTSVGPWTFELALHGTDSATETFDDAADTRVVASVSANF